MCSELDGDNCRAQQRGDRNSTKQDLTIYKTRRYFAQAHDIGVQCKFHLRTMCSWNKKTFSPHLNSTRTEPSFTIFTRKGGFQIIYDIFLIYVHLKITEIIWLQISFRSDIITATKLPSRKKRKSNRKERERTWVPSWHAWVPWNKIWCTGSMKLLCRSYQSDHNLLKNSLMHGKWRVCQGKWLLHVKQTDRRCSEIMNQVMFKHTKNYLSAFLVMIKESWAHTSQSSPLLDLGLRDVDCTTGPFFAVEEEEFVVLLPPPANQMILLVPPVLHQIGFHIKWYWFKNGKPKCQDHAFGVPTCSALFPFKMLPIAMIFSQYFAMKHSAIGLHKPRQLQHQWDIICSLTSLCSLFNIIILWLLQSSILLQFSSSSDQSFKEDQSLQDLFCCDCHSSIW